MDLEKRPYEEKAVRDLRRDLAEHGKVIAVAPTGAGKTVIAALLISREQRWKHILFVAHRYELIDQAHRTLEGLGIRAAITMAQEERLHGETRVDPDARVQVASIQTLDSRGAPKADLIIFDEAHRSLSATCQRLAAAIPRADVLGLTATPCRLDGQGLGDFFKHMRIMARPSELYEQGYLARPRTFGAPAGTILELTKRLRGVRSANGDYEAGALGRAVDTSKLAGSVVEETIRIAPGVPKVVFACGVRHSNRIAEEFESRGIRAAHIDASTEPDRRERILGSLASGAIEVVCNVDVLSEGWDLPSLGAVVLARPTKSLGRFLQMTGRVQRPYKNKAPIIIDHGNNWLRFQMLPDDDIEWSLEQGGPLRAGEAIYRACPACAIAIPIGCTTCPACNAEIPRSKTERDEKQEVAMRLEELNRKRLGELRARVDAMARAKNAPPGWAERVIRGVQGR